MHGTDKADGDIMVLFFGLVFSVAPPLEILLPTSLAIPVKNIQVLP